MKPTDSNHWSFRLLSPVSCVIRIEGEAHRGAAIVCVSTSDVKLLGAAQEGLHLLGLVGELAERD
jgi:hypothetical protein